MSVRNFNIRVHHEEGSFWAEVLDLPGCFASGDSLGELWPAIEDAIGLYLSDEQQEVRIVLNPPEQAEYEARVLVG